MPEVIVFTSGKGGVGKSNLCLNTALQLTTLHYRTCLFDGDLGLANVNVLLGIDQEYTLDDVVFNSRSIDEILVRTGYGFDIIPGSSGVEKIADLNADQLQSLISALTVIDSYDYFLIDTASGISRSVISFCMAATTTVIVITREATSLTDAYALLKILSVKGYRGAVRILINNCESVPQAKSTYLRYKKVVEKHLDIAIAPAGIILHDDHFERAVVQQKPLLELYPESIGAQCIRALVANLTSDQGAEPEREEVSGFWQRYLDQIAGEKISSGGGVKGPEPEQAAAGPAALSRHAVPPVDAEVSLFRAIAAGPGGVSAPPLLAAVLRRLNHGEIGAGQLRELILVDPALLVQALALLPLDEVAPQGHIADLQGLVARLDAEDLEPMLLQAAVRSAVVDATDCGDDRGVGRWLHHYRCALLAREIARAVAFSYIDEAYVAGLLLDIGAGRVGRDEEDITGSGHAEAGADLLQALGLNSMICDAVRFHHHPPAQVGTAFALVRIVYAAQALLSGSGVEGGASLGGDIVDLTEEQALELRDQVIRLSARTATLLGLDPGGETTSPTAAVNGTLSGHLLDTLLTRTIMAPLGPSASLQDWARRLHRSCALLAGVRRLICFVAAADGTSLTPVSFDGCCCADHLHGIVIPADSGSSVVSRVYRSGEPLLCDLTGDAALNLGDRQLGGLLGGDALLCIPLRANGRSAGLVVCGIDGGPGADTDRRLGQLLTIGSRAATDLDRIRASSA